MTIPEGLLRGVETVVTEEELAARLAGPPMTLKLGVDPTSPDIHVGHLVILRVLRRFQELGHEVVFVVGDFTALVGDPSGQNKTRPVLTAAEVDENQARYRDQVLRFLLPERCEFVRNADWLGALGSAEVLRLCQERSLNRLLERDDFRARLEEGRPIRLHELLYPVFQAHDSVHLGCEVEIGGRDQLPNFMTTRDAMREAGQSPETVLCCPLLVGTDGQRKMSKSYGNQIGVDEPANDVYGKLMSLPDAAVPDYLELLTDVTRDDADRLLAGHPMEAKLVLAREVTAAVAGEEAAAESVEHFRRTVREGAEPDVVESVSIPGPVTLREALKLTPACGSGGEAKRLLAGGGVSVDGERATDPQMALEPGRTYRVRAGKRCWLDLEVT